MKLKILKICQGSRWKFWMIARDEVTVECDGKIKRFRLFKGKDSSLFLLLHHCKNKCLGRGQFDYKNWDEDWENFTKLFYFAERDLNKAIGKEMEF